MRVILALLLMTRLASADGERAGDFDYYILSLSWSPNWCALEGDARGSPQCDDNRELGWVLHGLWPEFEQGWPSYCRTSHRAPSRSQTAAMADIMGSSGAAWYQWKKHGTCSGLSAVEFFNIARDAYDAVSRPEVFRKLARPVKLPASVVEEAFLQANPDWSKDMLTITCKAGRIQEARLCLTKELIPRECSADARRDCGMTNALLDDIR
ncbi:MAG: ribonuclease T2 [Marinosulfonomonas sp.]|nr:ribonuclease T2 [Marinosulfonomonas sp.]